MVRFSKGDIWLVNLDPTVSKEQAKTRPCLIVSSNHLNNSSLELVIAIPITSKKRNFPSHVPISSAQTQLSVDSYLMCEQLRSISIMRLGTYIGMVDQETLASVTEILKFLLDI